MSWFDLIKDFQELIVGVGGFGAVVWTLRSNARLAREQREHEAGLARDQLAADAALAREQREVEAAAAREQRQREADLARDQRRQEIVELGRGILVELSQMRANVEHLAKKTFRADQKKERVVLPIYATPYFDASIQHVGRLPGAAVPIVVSAYLQIQRLREFMRSSALDKEAEHYFQLPVAQIGYVQQQCRHVAGRLSEAIEVLLEALGDHGLPVEALEWPLKVTDGRAPDQGSDASGSDP